MNLKKIQKPIENYLKDYNAFFKDMIKTKVSLLDIIISYITSKRGKQIRPVIVLLSAELCGGVSQRTYIGAAMVELLHTATLVHDDVVDQSDKRRGLATINAEWNNKIAVLIGDFLLAKGLLAATGTNEFQFLHATSKAVKRMSEGELLQIQKSKEIDLDEETYFRIIADKTASLISSCCEIGAISATDDKEIHNTLSEYGELVGTAFQIRDDIFDYTSDTTILGKPVGNDIKEKKITLPLIYACNNADKKDAKAIIKLFKNGKSNSEKISKIVDFVKTYNGLEEAANKAEEYSNKAFMLLNRFEDSPAKESLMNFAQFVVKRDL